MSDPGEALDFRGIEAEKARVFGGFDYERIGQLDHIDPTVEGDSSRRFRRNQAVIGRWNRLQ